MKLKWQKAFTVEKQRAEEFAELYKEMGYEVKFGMANHNCNSCPNENYITIYIRRR